MAIDFNERVPEFRANGAMVAPTVQELIDAYAKVAGADARFREAAELKKAAEEKAAGYQPYADLDGLVTKFKEGDPQAFLGIMQGKLGLSYQEAAKVWDALTEEASDDSANPVLTGKKKDGANVAFDVKSLPPDILADLAYARKMRESGAEETLDAAAALANKDARVRAKPLVVKALQGNPLLGKILSRGGSRESLVERVLDSVEAAVNNRVPFQTALSQAIANTAGFAKDIGLEDALNAEEQPNMFGLGSGPHNGRGFRLRQPEAPKELAEKDMHTKGAIGSFADQVVQFEIARQTGANENAYGNVE